jgi:hypothetical protein
LVNKVFTPAKRVEGKKKIMKTKKINHGKCLGNVCWIYDRGRKIFEVFKKVMKKAKKT